MVVNNSPNPGVRLTSHRNSTLHLDGEDGALARLRQTMADYARLSRILPGFCQSATSRPTTSAGAGQHSLYILSRLSRCYPALSKGVGDTEQGQHGLFYSVRIAHAMDGYEASDRQGAGVLWL